MRTIFTEDSLKGMGLIEQPDGTWKKQNVSSHMGMVLSDNTKLRMDSFLTRIKEKKKDPVEYFNIPEIDFSNPFFIPGNVISSKNNKVIGSRVITTKAGITKRVNRLFNNKPAEQYIRYSAYQWEKLAPLFKISLQGRAKPHLIELHFVMDHQFRWDYHNMSQLTLDLMVKYGWLEDDDKDSVKVSFKDYSIDKDKPGLYIKLL